MPPSGVSLVQDLGIVAAGAAVASILFRFLRLPVIFGYLAAGLFLGADIFPTPLVSDMDAMRQVSELGVVFLLFFMGLEFDLERLKSVLWPSFMAVAVQTIAMMFLARLVAPLFGWGYVSSLFFGSLLAISSSMVTMRVLQEQGRSKMPHAQLAAGIMILEDILAVILLVILSGVSVSKGFDWPSAWLVAFFMGVFVVAVYYIGRIATSRLANVTLGGGSVETVTIVSVGLLLGIGAMALKLHFSGALGAFVAGAILSRTKLAEPVLAANRSIKDLFCAIFFVTVGLQIDAGAIASNVGWVILLTVLMIAGKLASCWLGMFLAGQPPEKSYLASASKANIGEFSFIIIALGSSLHVIDTPGKTSLSAITFGLALSSILLTPLVSATASWQFAWLRRKAPAQAGRFARFYRDYLDTVFATLGRNKLLQLIRQPLLHLAGYFFLTSGVVLGGAFVARWVARLQIHSPVLLGLAVWVCTAVLTVPLVIAMARYISTIVYMVTESVFAKARTHTLIRGRVSNLVNTSATLLLLLLLGGFFLSVSSPYLPKGWALALFLILVIGVGVFFWRKMVTINSRIEALFLDSFSAEAALPARRIGEEYAERILRQYPWPVAVREVCLAADSAVCGRRIRELDLPRRTGSLIVAVVRGGVEAFDPSPEVPLFPEDRLILLGCDEANERAATLLGEKSANAAPSGGPDALEIGREVLQHGSSLDGNTLAGSNLRRRFGISVIGIQRGSEAIVNPGADAILKAGDILLFIGSGQRRTEFHTFLSSECAVSPSDGAPPPLEAVRDGM